MTDSYRILIVDDDPEDRAVLRQKYSRTDRYQFAVSEAESAEVALMKVKDVDYDLILVDLNLGSVDGLELVRSMSQQGVRAPVIVVTGVVTIERRAEAESTGVFQILSKDMVNEESLAVVSKLAIDAYRSDTPASQIQKILRAMVTRQEMAALGESLKSQGEALEALTKKLPDTAREAPGPQAPTWEKIVWRIEQRPLLWLVIGILSFFVLMIFVLSALLHPEVVNILGVGK